MRIKASEEWNRKLVVTDIPADPEFTKAIKTLDIVVTYDNDNKTNPCGNGAKACVLDGKVIPQIVKAVNCHDELVQSLKEMVDMFENQLGGAGGLEAIQRRDRARAILKAAMSKTD
jgi:hypothetical protein